MIKKRKDGRLCRNIINPITGKRKYFYGYSEREINRKILEFTTTCQKGRLFSEVADEWWTEAYEQISPNTVNGYKVALRRAVDEFGQKHVGEITPHTITVWLRKIAKQGFAQKTVKNHKIVVSRILQTAVMDGDIDFNPAHQAEIPRGLTVSKRLPATHADEQCTVLGTEIWLLPFFALMTGLRKGELLALQWQDIDFENNIISVTKSVYFLGNAPKIKKPKTDAGTRDVILLSDLKEKLVDLKGDNMQYIFSLNGGKSPLTESQYDKLMREYKEKTGFSATAQRLRKSFATAAAASGIDKKVLQSVMGHTDISTTLAIYASVHQVAFDNARDKLEAISPAKAKKI
ncbi:MAG: site-specific integrase [Clostridia bacterium]|nr:site-specific integrase [Clostridia bacterium]